MFPETLVYIAMTGCQYLKAKVVQSYRENKKEPTKNMQGLSLRNSSRI